MNSELIANRSQPRPFWARLQSPALWLVSVLYLVQLWTPLRLSGDSIELLSVASSAADGHGFRENGHATRFLPGYPTMIIALDRIGAARSWGIVGLNILFLFIAFFSAFYIAKHYFELDSDWAIAAVLFTLLSFALIKHFTLPLTDTPFFGISLLILALLVKAEARAASSYYFLWTLALLLTVAGVFVRPLSVALFPGLLWSLVDRLGFRSLLRIHRRTVLLLSSIAVGVAAILVSILLFRSEYVQEALASIAGNRLGLIIRDNLLFRVHEFGELFLNIPASKLGPFSSLVWIAGVFAIGTLFLCLRPRRFGPVEIYLACYVFILLLWPYEDTRFWTPVLPLLAAEFFRSTRPWTFTGWRMRASMLYAVLYALAGFAALSYSTWITFSGREFPHRYGNESIRATYETFYGLPNADRTKADPEALEMLRRYSPRKR